MVRLLRLVCIFCVCQTGLSETFSCQNGLFIKRRSRKIKLSNVTDLWLENCDNKFKNVSHHNILDIIVVSSNFQLASLSEVLLKFKISKHVTDVNITNSAVTKVPSDVFISYTNLKWIDLQYNRISTLEENAFHNLDDLQHIDLRNNQISVLEKNAFHNLPGLTQLILENNMIIEIQPFVFNNVPGLKQVFLQNNRLGSVPYRTFKTVTYMNISNNNITGVTKEIAVMRNMRTLDISSNSLRTIDKAIAGLPNLIKLNIVNNNLTSLPFEMCHVFNRSEFQIQLRQNPWVCDCSLVWLIKIVQSGYTEETMYCRSPADIAMVQYDVTNMKCDDVILSIDSGLSLPVMVLLAASVTVVMICTGLYAVRLRKTTKEKRSMMEVNTSYVNYKDPNIADTSARLLTNDSNVSQKHVDNGVLTYDNLRLTKLIGRGAFGEVYGGYARFAGKVSKKVAVKKLRETSTETTTQLIEREIQYIKDFEKHPNIIQVYGSSIISGSQFIVMELAELGDLLTYLRGLQRSSNKEVSNLDQSEQKSYLQRSYPQLFVFLWSVAKGMEFLSSLKIVHRDLAARNVLLTKGPIAKISDFGLSRDVYETGFYFQESAERVPYKWMSPESLSEGKYTTKSDVWSYAVLAWEVMTLGGSPHPGIPPDMLQGMYKKGYILPQSALCPDLVYIIMTNCWRLNALKRPSFKELVDELDKFIQTGSNQDYMEFNIDDESSMSTHNYEQKTSQNMFQ